MSKLDQSEVSSKNNPFMTGYDTGLLSPFVPDTECSYKFDKGLITENWFASVEKLIKQVRPDMKVVLNMGDSSTSGWHSDYVYKDNRNPYAPFFRYPTYSDIVRQQGDLAVFNAGVPGYTSLQGSQYLKELLAVFAEYRQKIDYITLYFGNNDALHSSASDYQADLTQLIAQAKSTDVRVVAIKPLINYRWQPGLRSKKHLGEFAVALDVLQDLTIKSELAQAQVLFREQDYKQALEQDGVLPRLKAKHADAFDQVIAKAGVEVIDLQEQLGDGGAEYFIDYCHPNQQASQLIANAFFQLTGLDQSSVQVSPVAPAWQFRCWELFDRVAQKVAPARKDSRVDIYSLY